MVRSFFIALQFLTRIQLVSLPEVSKEEFSESTAAYPLVGLAIGALSMAVFWTSFAVLGLPVLVAAVLTAGASIAVTGGLHLDGLMDTADSLYSWRSREKMLAIMKDSRIGANAAIALVCVVLLKVSLLTSLGGVLLPVLVLLPVFSRMAVVCLAYGYPHATEQAGLGSGVIGRVERKSVFVAGSATALVVGAWVAVLRWAGVGSTAFWAIQALVLLAATCLLSWMLARTAKRRLGGITGDVLGAAVELSETGALLAAVVVGGVWMS